MPDENDVPHEVENELSLDGWHDRPFPLSAEEYRTIEGFPQEREETSDERSSK